MTKQTPIIVFLASRAILFLSLPLDGLIGYGDLGPFFELARLDGWPFFDYWVEFPPVFPFVVEIAYRLTGEIAHNFYYFQAVLFSLFQAANIALFSRIAIILTPDLAEKRVWLYATLLLGLFYGWTYFDPAAVFLLLLGLFWAISDKKIQSAAAFALGALVKWFPLLALSVLLRMSSKKWWHFFLVSTAMIVLVWGTLMLISPDFTAASLKSQFAKGSWETVWALIDGNLLTGNFGPKSERYDPAAASNPLGNPAVVPPAITLIPFAVLGLWVFLKSRLETPRSQVAFVAFTLCLFFLWSPGWSPQWVLYLLPFILLLLKNRMAILFSAVFLLVNLLEWPLLLSRGLFWGLYITVPIRTFLLILLAWEFWTMIPRGKTQFILTESS